MKLQQITIGQYVVTEYKTPDGKKFGAVARKPDPKDAKDSKAIKDGDGNICVDEFRSFASAKQKAKAWDEADRGDPKKKALIQKIEALHLELDGRPLLSGDMLMAWPMAHLRKEIARLEGIKAART